MTPPPGRNVPRLLSGLAVLFLATLAWRVYSPQTGARPTEAVNIARTIDLNAADRAELLQVPGVGPHMADAIIAHRQARGRFETLEELDTVPGIGGKTLDKLRPWMTLGPGIMSVEPVERLVRKAAPTVAPSGKMININTAAIEELNTLPGIGPKLAERIIAERKNGVYKTVEDLRRVSGIGPKTVEKLRSLIAIQ